MQANSSAEITDKPCNSAVLEAIPNAALAYDGSTDTFFFNEQAAQWFGVEQAYTPVKRGTLDFQVTKVDEQFSIQSEKTPWQRAWNGEIVDGLELVLTASEQAPRYILCNSHCVAASNHFSRMAVVSMVDISTARIEHQSLLNGRAHMRMILEGTDAGTWQWNIQTGEIQFNQRWAQIVGYTLEEMAPVSINTWIKLAHPEDLKESDLLLKKHFAGTIPHYNLVVRLKHKQGHWVWVQGRGRVYQWDVEGKPLWMAGTHLDVSDLRWAEQEARSSQAYMQALIDSSADVAIIATNTEGLITVFNTGAQKLLGYSEEEVVGNHTPALFHLESEVTARGRDLSDVAGYAIAGFDVFVHAARHGKSDTRQWTYVCKSGEHRTVSLAVSALRDGEQRVIGFLGMAVDETAKLAAQEQARLSAQRFAGAFSSTAVGMALVSLDGRWMEVNDALCKMLAYSRDELLNTDFQTLTHPEDLQNDLSLLQRLLAGKIPNYEMQKRYYRKTGDLIQAKLWVALVRDSIGAPLHFVSQIQNITDEYLARQALQGSEARLRGLFDLSPVGISLMDFKTGRQLEANTALVAPTGYSQEEFLALSDRELTPPEYSPLMSKAIEQLRSVGRYAPFEKEYIRKDRTRYPVLVQGILMKDRSGREVIWSLVEDISERRRLDRIKNEFVSTISHELRTPLTSITGALSLVVGGVLGDVNQEVRDMLNIAAKNSERLNALVSDILDIDKLTAGKLELKVEQADLLVVMDDALDSMKAFAYSHGVELVRTSNTPVLLDIDSARLIQVLTNLLSNACKHSHRGGKVELHHALGPQDSVILSVIDHGKGIPKDFRAQVFQKFAQADSSDASARKGTGLGLAICKELVERMGGVIGYESNEGEGTHFWLRLPQANTPAIVAQQSPRILLIEDDTSFAKLLKLQIDHWVEIDHANDVALACQLITEHHYDLILVDLYLPEGTGASLWEALSHSHAQTPIVILSGHEVPRKLAKNVAAVLIKDDTSLVKLISTLQKLFAMGDE